MSTGVAVSNHYVTYKHDQFPYPASSIATFSPSLAASFPTGIPNALPNNVSVVMLNFKFSF